MASESALPANVIQQGVLVVDDSEVQRIFTTKLLRQMGVERVAEAGNGYAALSRLYALDPSPAVLIVDLEMPMMDGVELIQQMARTSYRPSLIIASGRETALIDSVASMSEAMNLPLLGVVYKPFTAERLRELLCKVCEAPPVPAEPARDESSITAQDIELALAAGFIRPYFQPKVDLATGDMQGVEALARWIEPGKRIVPPNEFVPVAEASGQMRALTLVMLQQCIGVLKEWALHQRPWTMAINLSPATLSDMLLADTIIRMVEAAQLETQKIVFEVTESTMTDIVATGALLRLRLRGFGLSIDDYGTGFSSMQQLSRLPFSELKLDRSLVNGAHARSNLRTILESAIDMAQRLGLKTVAEGVETWDDWRLLQSLGCNLAQGYLIAKPAPAEALPESLADFGRRMRSF